MKALAALVLLLGLTACSGGDADGTVDGDRDRATDAAPAPAPPSSSGPADPGAGLADTEVCGLVRDGIDAFNLGDLEATIKTFEKAIGPAEDLARDQPSPDTETLLDAVRYYAGLSADDYVEANQSSPEFQRFKDFTLTECAYESPPQGATPTDPGIPA